MNFSEKARAMRMKSPLTLREIGEQRKYGIALHFRRGETAG